MKAFAFCAVALVAAVASLVAADCETKPAPTATWKTSCLGFNTSDNADCWVSGKTPSATDTILFPTGSNVTVLFKANASFKLFMVQNIIIAEGALVKMTWAGLQIPNGGCFFVEGNLTMSPNETFSGSNSMVEGTPKYLADPTVPEGTDCPMLPQGFVPRICGPGQMRVRKGGRIFMENYYASLFITTVVEDGGHLEASSGAFIWANVTVQEGGELVSKSWVYMHGFVFNWGTATFDTVVFDKWATAFVETPPIMLENHGTMTFNSRTHNTHTDYKMANKGQRHGVYKAAVVNYKSVTFQADSDGASSYFDLFNYGTVAWLGVTWIGNGNFINHGNFESADGSNVYISTYYSVGGTLTVGDSSYFNFGNGATDPRNVRLCVLSQHAPVNPVPTLRRVKKRQAPPPSLTVEQRDGCWWYGSFCYQTPYLWNLPQLQLPGTNNALPSGAGREELPAADVELEKLSEVKGLQGRNLLKGVSIALETAIRRAPVPQACNRRYVFEGRSRIMGGVKSSGGSVLTTLPITVEGSLEIVSGGKWHAMIENEQPPVFGGGMIRVRGSGELYLGIDAVFSHAGTLQVDQGGLVGIPKHGKVTFSNHTVQINRGGILHVDGKMTTMTEYSTVKQCGELRGQGQIVKSKNEDLDC